MVAVGIFGQAKEVCENSVGHAQRRISYIRTVNGVIIHLRYDNVQKKQHGATDLGGAAGLAV